MYYIRLIFVKKSLLVKILGNLPGFNIIKSLLNGSVLVGIPIMKKDLYSFNLVLDKKHKAIIIGAFLNQTLYGNSFIIRLSKLDHNVIYNSLISVCLRNQLTLTSLLSIHSKK